MEAIMTNVVTMYKSGGEQAERALNFLGVYQPDVKVPTTLIDPVLHSISRAENLYAVNSDHCNYIHNSQNISLFLTSFLCLP